MLRRKYPRCAAPKRFQPDTNLNSRERLSRRRDVVGLLRTALNRVTPVIFPVAVGRVTSNVYEQSFLVKLKKLNGMF